MAGMVYRSPAPGEPPFCKEGDRVTKGQTICIIEAMKLMNEIEVRSPAGTLACLSMPAGTAIPAASATADLCSEQMDMGT